MSLNFCVTIQILGSEIGVNNIKPWIYGVRIFSHQWTFPFTDVCTWIHTWTSQKFPRWPARSCRSWHRSYMSLCRGTRWKGSCGTPPGRSRGRRAPDRSPLHPHWCAVGRERRIRIVENIFFSFLYLWTPSERGKRQKMGVLVTCAVLV